jgi:hypothetical protein
MSNSDMISNALYLKLKNQFPGVTFGDQNSLQTNDVNQAVFFEFPFVVRGEKIASITISLAEKGNLKLLRTEDSLENQDDHVKGIWFKFLRDMRKFAKSRLLNFEPLDPIKGQIQKKDYDSFAASASTPDNTKDSAMTESTLYGSTKSSYQKLENAKLIIRHSKRIEEDSPNNRTRNISAVFIESENGERFRYPFNHLAGARAMCRHAANGGSPYDDFGQYIVSLSENIFSLRRFNHLVNRAAFLENSEIVGIAESAKEKANSLKKVLESIKRQHGYEKIKEAFVKEEKKEIDEDLIEQLKEKFTLHQFNEELSDLFPYITDLLGEGGGTASMGMRNPAEPKGNKLGDPRGNNMSTTDMLENEFGSPEEILRSVAETLEREVEWPLTEIMDGATVKKLIAPLMNAIQEKLQQVSQDDEVAEAKPFVKGAPAKGQGKPTGDYDDTDAAQEPVTDYKDRPRDEAWDLKTAIEAASVIKMEPFDKESIVKAIDGTQNQIKELKKAAEQNPKEKKIQYGIEKAEARLGLLQARLGTSETKATNNVTKNALTIEHLATHVKDDRISLLLSRIADDYPRMDKSEQKEVNELIRFMMSKVKLVPMFSAESTTFEELESLLGSPENKLESTDTRKDYVSDYETMLDSVIGEANDILSLDPDVRERAVNTLNQLMKENFPVGTNGINAKESLRGIIDDPKLNDIFEQISKKDSEASANEAILAWIRENAPELEQELNMSEGPIDEPASMDPAAEAEPSQEEIMEFVKSLYDSTTGNFPRGETGVEISVQKKFGDHALPFAKECIMSLKNNFDENIFRMRKLAGVS